MSLHSPIFADPHPAAPDAAPEGDTIAQRCNALEQAGAIVAVLAGIDTASRTEEFSSLAERLDDLCGPRRALAEHSLDDLVAIMQPGVAALLAAAERGVEPSAPALALYGEFSAARDALAVLLPPEPCDE